MSAVLLCLVIAVSDGDSLKVRCPQRQELRVRIASMDAPELRQAYGQQSRRQLYQWCYRQQAQITVKGTDRYRRTLAEVRCKGQDMATLQVRTGLAWVYTPHAYRYPQLATLQEQARASGIGLWRQKRPLPPWDYRRRSKKS